MTDLHQHQPEWVSDALASDMTALEKSFPFAPRMRETDQDSLYHAEGNVWTHTRMVMDEVVRGGSPDDVMRLTALLHDCAKPETTVREWCDTENRERIRQPNHARKGADKAWRLMIDSGIPVLTARKVCDLIAWHQRPSHVLEQHREREDIDSRIGSWSVTGHGWEDLLNFCRYDNRGRISPGTEDAIAGLDLLQEEIESLSERLGKDLMRGDRFSPETRFRFGETWRTSPFFDHETPDGARLIITCGLPGSGKSTWASRQEDATVVSMDRIRVRTGRTRRTEKDEGRVLQEAFSELREALSKKSGTVIWDGTCLDQRARSIVSRIGRNYGAAVTIASFDVPAEVAWDRNMSRGEERIPMAWFGAAAERREYPAPHEAHGIMSIDAAGNVTPVYETDEDVLRVRMDQEAPTF